MAINRTLPLEERIQNIRADIDAYIDARVEADRKANPGVPGPVLRNLITVRAGGCQCAVYLDLTKQDDAA
jgi:hypothetical protein